MKTNTATLSAPATESPPVCVVASKRIWTVGSLVYTGVGLATLYAWLLWGDFAWQLKERTGPIVQVMLGQHRASDFVTALFMISLPAVISMVVGPFVGFWSDHHRGPRGRRIPFLLVTTPIAGATLVGVALGPWLGARLHGALGWDAGSQHVTILVVMAFFWTLFEIATVAANTVFGGLINDVVPRELIGRFFGLFRIVSLAVGIGLYTGVVGHSKTHAPEILITLSAVYVVGFTMMCLKVKEGEYPEPPPASARPRFAAWDTWKNLGRSCLGSPYYLSVFLFMGLAVTSFIPVNLYMVFAAEHFGLSLDDYGKCMAVMFGFSLASAYPLGWLVDRFHATRAGLFCIALYALLMGVAFFIVEGPATFRVMLIAHGVVSACYNTAVCALGQMLFPKEKFAQFAGAAMFVTAFAGIVLSPFFGLLLDYLHRDYRYTFGLSSLIALVALCMGLRMYRRFRQLGGPAAYEAP